MARLGWWDVALVKDFGICPTLRELTQFTAPDIPRNRDGRDEIRLLPHRAQREAFYHANDGAPKTCSTVCE